MSALTKLLDLAMVEDAEALFQIGKKAFAEKKMGFAKIFLTSADLNNHSEAKNFLTVIEKSVGQAVSGKKRVRVPVQAS
jgi:hypothetical protein